MEEKITYEYESHNLQKIYKSIPWLVCKNCGLIVLRNSFTKWCVDKGCMAEYHPGYKNAMKGR